MHKDVKTVKFKEGIYYGISRNSVLTKEFLALMEKGLEDLSKDLQINKSELTPDNLHGDYLFKTDVIWFLFNKTSSSIHTIGTKDNIFDIIKISSNEEKKDFSIFYSSVIVPEDIDTILNSPGTRNIVETLKKYELERDEKRQNGMTLIQLVSPE